MLELTHYPPSAKPLLELAIQKRLKGFDLQVELNLSAEQGQVLVLFGPSGSGKTMTLRCIAGVTDPDAGSISIGGQAVFDSRIGLNLKLQKRRVGYLPQNYALFPHLNVAGNIAFGLFRWEKKRSAGRVRELVALMQLEGLERRYPRELSGGQQQRVAFARALAPEPAILLLDEPFSALDAAIRAELRQNLALISRELAVPVVFITHDLEEAYLLADRIAVYNQGRVLQYSDRDEIFYRPATREVARLVGIHNLWEGRVLSFGQAGGLVQVRTAFADLWVQLPARVAPLQPGSSVTVCLRSERAKLLAGNAPAVSDGRQNRFTGQIVGEMARGSLYTLFFRLDQANQAPASLREDVSLTGIGSILSSIGKPGLLPPYDLELEISAPVYNELKETRPGNWQVEISPAALHLIPHFNPDVLK